MTTAAEISWDDLKKMIFAHNEQLRETDRLIRELRESSKETDRRLQETDRLVQETTASVKALRQELGRLGNRLGEFVQDMVQPAVVRLFQAQGIPVHRVYPNAVARRSRDEPVMEIDLLVINGNHAIAVECKSRLTTSDVDEHLARLAEFKAYFTEHADKVLHGVVAGMSVPENVARYAERQGLYVLVQADDDVVVANRPDFTLKSW